ncbi:MAG: ATP-binding protein [Acidobacteria bacterium]|nr:ATP-binding protein [Acidobacteriota bacterium]
MAPVALKAAGCATAFFLGGPMAAAMAAYGGDTILKLLELSGQESLKKFPEALAGNLGNFIAGAAHDSVKDANAGSLRGLFRDALAATLQAIRAELIPEMRVEDRSYYEGWFERWEKRLKKDNLPEFTDGSLLQRFVRSDAATVEDAVGPVLIDILMRLDAQGVLQLEQKPVDPVLEAALRERMPLHLPLQLSSALADRDKLWKIVQDQKITLILQRVGELQAAPVTAEPLLLGAKARKLAPSQGAFFGRSDDVRELVRRLAMDDASILYVSGAPGIGKTALCRAALREYLSGHPEAAALFVDLRAAVNRETLVAACAEVLGDRSLRNEGEVRQCLVRTAAKRGGPVVVYLDNFESVAGAEGSMAFVRSLAELDGIRVLCSTRLNLSSAVGWGMEVHALDVDSAADLFLQCWHREAKAPRISRTAELDRFLRDRLSFHALSVVLTASRGAFYRSLARVIEEWNTQGTSFAAAEAESLRKSLLLSWKILGLEEQQSFLLFALFAEGVTSATWGDLVRLAPRAWQHRARLSELSL